MNKLKKCTSQSGITLVALIITIIVMLILVAVSISVTLNTGLFKSTQTAAQNTQKAKNEELNMSDGKITVGHTKYESLDEYVNRESTIDFKIKDPETGDYLECEAREGATWQNLSDSNAIEFSGDYHFGHGTDLAILGADSSSFEIRLNDEAIEYSDIIVADATYETVQTWTGIYRP